jgi:2,3-dihydroxybenzoate-AMP ligase
MAAAYRATSAERVLTVDTDVYILTSMSIATSGAGPGVKTAPVLRADPDLVPYPADLAEQYRQAGYWLGRSLPAELGTAMSEHASRTALITSEIRWTYRELDRNCELFAAGILSATSLRPGDPVMFSMGNVAETLVAYYGALRAGLVPVCTLPQHRERELGLLAAHTGARGIFVQGDFKDYRLAAVATKVAAASDWIEEIVVARGDPPPGAVGYDNVMAAGTDAAARARLAAIQIDPASVAVYQLSGGTTGLPKVAPRLHEEYCYNSRQWARALGWAPGTVVLYPLPVMHNAGIALAMQPAHLSGATAVLTASADTGVILDAITAERPSVLPLIPPAVAIRLLDDPRTREVDLSCIRDFVIGGQRLPEEVGARLERELAIRCRQMFGMAEGMFMLTPASAADQVRLGTVGAPISPADEVRIYDVGTETEVPDGEAGEFCARGPYTIRGYFRAHEHNRSAFTSDGFYRSGDLARRHLVAGRAYYSIDGRIKDVINRGLEKIHAEEVEELVLRHPDVHAAVVVAMPDPVLGERACAYLILEDGAGPVTVGSLAALLSAHGLAKYKFPERVEIVREFPLTNVGKVSKKLLREDIVAKLAREKGHVRDVAAH